MKARNLAHRFLASFACGAALLASSVAMGESALLTKDGTLYEVFPARYGEVVAGAGNTADARTPVLALRTTPSGEASRTEIVQGTLDGNDEDSASLEYDEITNTVFVAYTKFQGLMADVHVTVRRDGRWVEQNIIPNLGLYLSLNPRMVVTRQSWIDFDGYGGIVKKNRSILSMVFWEETGSLSQGRYACVFVEDGVLRLDDFIVLNLNELAGVTGATQIQGLPFSAYQFPSVQRDPTTNGGVLVSFANLAMQRQVVLQVTFPDDIRKLVAPGSTRANRDAYARAHIPLGRTGRDFRIPEQIRTTQAVGTVVSSQGVPTYYWIDTGSVNFLRGDSDFDAKPKSIRIRPDFSADRGIAVVREMAEKY